MQINLSLNENALQQLLADQMMQGDFGANVARELAMLHAEVKMLSVSETAETLNVSRTTVYEYIEAGKLVFNDKKKISLAKLVEFSRAQSEEKPADEIEKEKTPARRLARVKRRILK